MSGRVERSDPDATAPGWLTCHAGLVADMVGLACVLLGAAAFDPLPADGGCRAVSYMDGTRFSLHYESRSTCEAAAEPTAGTCSCGVRAAP